jgi:hypothetical protein
LDTKEFVQKRVKKFYWHDDINCATTNLKILSEKFGIELSDQIINSALGMHGAGVYGAQCGLVECTLMFIGILGRTLNISDDDIVNSCNEFAGQFENRFKSLLCNILRPEGFNPNNQPHLCEKITCEAIFFNIDFITRFSNNCKALGSTYK